MNRKEFLSTTFKGTVAAVALSTFPGLLQTASAAAEEKPKSGLSRADLLAAAREIMAAQTYCALTTIDEGGLPRVRTMNPFPPEEDMTVYMATNTASRKVRQIRHDSRVMLYYSNHGNAIGYVEITGRAVLVDDPAEIKKRKRAYWDTSFAPGLKNLVLIKVVPEHIDVLNYSRHATADPNTWRTPSLDLKASEPAI